MNTIRLLIRLEGLAVFLASLYFYNQLGASWVIFIVLWLLPDISMIAYLRDTKTGAIMYNLVHSYVLALSIILLGVWRGDNLIASLGIILISHIGLDRFLGYGLKYPTGFKDTHVQRL